MKVWIDDERKPKDYLSEKDAESVIWIKEIREALNLFLKKSEEIEVLYLDYYMDSPVIFGSEFVFYAKRGGKKMFPNLKSIYLHSNDDDAIDELMELAPNLENQGISLEVAPYRNKKGNCRG